MKKAMKQHKEHNRKGIQNSLLRRHFLAYQFHYEKKLGSGGHNKLAKEISLHAILLFFFQWNEKIFNAEIKFFELVGKNVSDKLYEGKFIRLSTDEQYALIRTKKHLENFQNLMIDIGQDLYVKVIENNNNNYTVCFTAKPGNFNIWIKNISFSEN